MIVLEHTKELKNPIDNPRISLQAINSCQTRVHLYFAPKISRIRNNGDDWELDIKDTKNLSIKGSHTFSFNFFYIYHTCIS